MAHSPLWPPVAKILYDNAQNGTPIKNQLEKELEELKMSPTTQSTTKPAVTNPVQQALCLLRLRLLALAKRVGA